MELIWTKYEDGQATSGYLTHYQGDFEISTDSENGQNDFEITMPIPDDGELLYSDTGAYTVEVGVPHTEWGGKITGATIDAKAGVVTYKGFTWRGYLTQTIIQPPYGVDYMVGSGTLQQIMEWDIPWEPDVAIKSTPSTGNRTFTFNRYVTSLEGATALLNSINQNYRIYIAYEESDDPDLEGMHEIQVSVAPTKNVTDLIQVSQDYGDIPLTITYAHDTPKHLICLGQGELAERQVAHWYLTSDWQLTPYGDDPESPEYVYPYPEEVYDNSNSTDIVNDGKKKMLEILANHRQIEVNLEGLEGVGLNNIISAKDELTGVTITAEVTGVIWRVENYGEWQKESMEYKTKVTTELVQKAK